MYRLLILLVVVSTTTFRCASGISCWECSEAKSDKDCRATGKLRQCRFNQDACEIELRQHEGWGSGLYIYKHCKQSKACDNNHIQNPKSAWEPSQCNLDDFNSVCRCCCYEDECNVAQDACLARRGCGRLPTTIPRGTISCSNNEYAHGSSCTVTCNSNARLIGTAITFCRFDGSWSNSLAQCLDSQCESRDALLNGWYICSNSQYVGSTCTAFCRPGFTLVGATVNTCMGTTLQWNYRPPICQPLQCPERGLVPGGVVNCTDGQNVQSRCRVECEGFRRLDGIADSYCEDAGTWSHALPTCVDIQCDLRGSIVNGDVTCTLGVEVTSLCIAVCDEGYGADGVAQSTCLATGNWDNPLPRCNRLQCPPRGKVEFGVVTCSDESFVNSACTVVCAEGTRLVGADISVCQPSGFFDVPLPTCERVECPERGEVIGGTVSCSNKRFVGSICIAQCNVGSRLFGVPNSVCLVSGEWSEPLPTCDAIICPALDFSTQPGNMFCTNEYFYASTCSFTCEPGYRIFGAPRVSCRRNGLWTTRVPECRPVTCRLRGRLPNGVVVCTNENEVESICDASCNAGYEIRGLSTSTCLGTGRWDINLPSCQPIRCPFRTSLVGGTITCTDDNFYRSVCTATCTGGRQLTGAPFSTCTDIGDWDEPLPSCAGRPCAGQGDLEHGNIRCTNDWNVQSVCTFTCEDEGYELYPPARTTNLCRPNQRWSLPKPCCSRPCPPYAVMDLILVLDSSSSIGPGNWELLKEFVKDVIKGFTVAPDAANIAFFRYNRVVDTSTEVLLNDHPGDIEGLVTALNAIPYDGSGTFTGNALNHALTVSMSQANGNRPGVKDLVLVITDGKAADLVGPPADAIRATGAQILVLGIEPPKGALNLKQLREIAGSDQNLIIASGGFGGLDQAFSMRLGNAICGDPCSR